MALIINPRNKQQEKGVKAFLSSLDIGFYSEAEEDAALGNAIQKGRKTVLLTKKEKSDFLKRLKQANEHRDSKILSKSVTILLLISAKPSEIGTSYFL